MPNGFGYGAAEPPEVRIQRAELKPPDSGGLVYSDKNVGLSVLPKR